VSLPIPTTTITVKRRAHDPTADAYDPDTAGPTLVASGVPAHFSSLVAVEVTDGSSQRYTATLLADPVDLDHADVVVDELSGWEWEVTSARVVTDTERRVLDDTAHVTAGVVHHAGVG